MSIEVIGLEKSYGAYQVLRGAALRVAGGEVVAVRGASGTGKSTLLHCLGLLDTPQRGTIRIGEVEATALSDAARSRLRAHRLGFIFQAYHLLPEFTALENVVMAARAAGVAVPPARARALALLDRLGMAACAHRLPATLSGGERQRTAVARALLMKPAVVLADEPTGNLDPATALIVLDEMIALARGDGAAVVLVTHDPAIAQRADRVVILRDGQLHAEATL